MGITAAAVSDVAKEFRVNLGAASELNKNATRLAEEVSKPSVDWTNVSKLAQNVGNGTTWIGELPGVKSSAIRTAVESLQSLRRPARSVEVAANQLAYNEMRTVRLWSVENPVNPVSVYRDATSLAESTHAGVNDLLKALGVAPR